MHLKLTAADKSDVGKQRDQNEDYSYTRVEPFEEGDRGLFIVADGMGGYKAGEIASRLAVETITKTLDSFFKPISDQTTVKLPIPVVDADSDAPTVKLSPSTIEKQQKTQKLPETPQSQRIEEQLRIAVEQANKAILQYGEKQSSARGLGCTLTAALIQNNKAYIANVGDSRTYLLRDDVLKLITRDHSLVARLVESKQIDPEDVYTHPQRNLIYRSLGAGHKNIEVDIFHEVLRPGDMLLLCSDGLWEMVHDPELSIVLREKASPQQICNTLIDKANTNGGEDNISAVVVRVNEH